LKKIKDFGGLALSKSQRKAPPGGSPPWIRHYSFFYKTFWKNMHLASPAARAAREAGGQAGFPVRAAIVRRGGRRSKGPPARGEPWKSSQKRKRALIFGPRAPEEKKTLSQVIYISKEEIILGNKNNKWRGGWEKGRKRREEKKRRREGKRGRKEWY
jgi:hypothetical protein